MKHILRLLLFFAMLHFSMLSAHAGDWQTTPSYSKSFVENKGQFNGRNKLSGSDIRYAIDHGPFQVYFTKNGLTYRLDEKIREKKERDPKEHMKEEMREMKEKAEGKRKVEMRSDILHLEFLNSNPDVSIEASEEVTEYFNYSMGSNSIHYDGARGFRKLTYKEIYPGIDLVFSFDEQQGFKYAFHLQPGADPGLIAMKYGRNAKVSLDEKGNILLRTRFGAITDHAPVSFLGGNSAQKVGTAFILKGNTVSFSVEGYDKAQALVIDPWVVFPTSPNSNKVWEVETDNAGNVYTYAGDMPFTLRKYSPAGTLLWTFTSSWDSSGFWVGGMITHPNGDTYMCTGSNGEIRKINAAGSQVWYNNPNGFLTSYEYWSLAFNCDLSRLVVGGSRAPFAFPLPTITGNIMEINLANGAILNNVLVGYGSTFNIPPNIQEVSSLCFAPNGRYYFLTLDTVGCIKDDLTTIFFKEPTNYSFDYYIPGYGFGTKQPISAIRADATAFYTQNGITVEKRDLNTGAVLASASIPGGISNNTFLSRKVQGNGGLDLDSCGNVYVGSGNGVYKFNSALNLLSSASTPGPVYDVDVSNNGDVAMSGSNFAGTVSLGACQRLSYICITTLTTFANATNVQCNGQCNGTASVSLLGGTPPYSYQWSNGFQTSSVAGLCAGVYTVIVQDAAGLSDTATVTVGSPAAIAVSTSVVNASCGASNGTATAAVSGGTQPFTYSWTPSGGTAATASGLSAGTYQVTVTDASGCTSTGSVTIGSSGGPQVTVAAVVNASCNNNSDGSATVNASGGTSPYTYLWSTTPPQTSATATGLSAGTYTVTVTDVNGCSTVQNVLVNAPTAITASVVVVGTSCSNGSDGSITLSASGGTAPYTYIWSTTPSQSTATATGLAPGTYTATVTDANACTYVQSATVGAPPSLAATVVVTNSACSNSTDGSAVISPSGGVPPYSYVWSTVPAQSTATATGLSAGVYTVTITDANNCTYAQAAIVSSPPAITATTNAVATTCGDTNGSLTISPVGGTSPFTYAWSGFPAQTTATATALAAGVYTITVTDANGCTGQFSGQVGASSPAVASAGNDTTIQAGTSVSLQASGGVTYTWTPDSNLTCTNCSSPVASPSITTTYYVTATDADGCTATDSVTISIKVEADCGEIYVPNAFSPGGDANAENEKQCVYGDCIRSMTFRIYTRWGELVFETTDRKNCWDGTHKGKALNSDVYVWTLQATLIDGRTVNKKGDLTLFR
jgi:gliding motility-associated-like protein